MKLYPVLFCLAVIVLFSGCSTYTNSIPPAYISSSSIPATLQLSLVNVQNWDSDADPDGLEATVLLKDSTGKMVLADGVIDAILWEEGDFNISARNYHENGALIDEWHNVTVKANSYSALGTTIRLEYHKPMTVKSGIFEINFTTNGKVFSTRDTTLLDI